MEITVRHAEPEYYEAMHRVMSAPKVAMGTLQLPLQSAAAWRKRLAEPPEGCSCWWLVSKGRWSGTSAWRPHPTARASDTLAPSVWPCATIGRDIGTALLGAALDLSDDWLNLSRIELTVCTDNTAGMSFLAYEVSSPVSPSCRRG